MIDTHGIPNIWTEQGNTRDILLDDTLQPRVALPAELLVRKRGSRFQERVHLDAIVPTPIKWTER